MSSDIEHEPWRTVEYGNLALVRAVKKRPCLYNNTLPEYSQKDLTRAAWDEIAEEFGCSAQKVKKKWKILRVAYFRKKTEQCFTHKKKPYYLDKHMNFLLPFTHSRYLLQKLASLCPDAKNNTKEMTYCEPAEKEIHAAIQNIKDIGYEVVIEAHTPNRIECNSYNVDKSNCAADESNLTADESTKVTTTLIECTSYDADESIFAADEIIKAAATYTPNHIECNSYDVGESNCAAEKSNFSADENSNAVDESNVTVDKNNDTPSIVKNCNTFNPIIVQIPSCSSKQRNEVNQKISDNYVGESLRIKPKSLPNLNLTLPVGENIRSKFMLSLLPEIYELNDSEFCVFKRKALKLIDDVRLS